jgi:hypothetical protein
MVPSPLSISTVPPSVQVGEQLATPLAATMVAETSNVMILALAAPRFSAKAHPVAASATLSFNFIVNPSVTNHRSRH